MTKVSEFDAMIKRRAHPARGAGAPPPLCHLSEIRRHVLRIESQRYLRIVEIQQVSRMSTATCGDEPHPRMSLRSSGLRLLLKMNGDTSDPKAVRAEFADAAQFVLQQRVRNLPFNRVFEVGWLRRIATYHRPIADPESSPKRALRKSLRMTAAQ